MGSDHFDNYLAQNNVKVDAGQVISLAVIVYVLAKIDTPDMKALARTADPPPLLYQSTLSSSDTKRGPPVVA